MTVAFADARRSRRQVDLAGIRAGGEEPISVEGNPLIQVFVAVTFNPSALALVRVVGRNRLRLPRERFAQLALLVGREPFNLFQNALYDGGRHTGSPPS